MLQQRPTSDVSDRRVTPYELIFGAPGFDETRFVAIREQLTSDAAASAASLALLPTAGELLRELLPEDDGAAAHGAVFTQVSALLFHAFMFWNEGQRTFTLGEPELRGLLGGRLASSGPVDPPAPAGYVQFPRNVVWSRVSEDTAPEPVDGFFWSAAQSGSTRRLDVLLALGVRRGRPGISIIDVALEDTSTLAHWAAVKARPAGDDFANVLPGGELQMYHAVTLHAEVLKLVALCFRALNTHG
jgi:hypothetical protein